MPSCLFPLLPRGHSANAVRPPNHLPVTTRPPHFLSHPLIPFDGWPPRRLMPRKQILSLPLPPSAAAAASSSAAAKPTGQSIFNRRINIVLLAPSTGGWTDDATPAPTLRSSALVAWRARSLHLNGLITRSNAAGRRRNEENIIMRLKLTSSRRQLAPLPLSILYWTPCSAARTLKRSTIERSS